MLLLFTALYAHSLNKLFHVKHWCFYVPLYLFATAYLPINTSRTFISLGDIPGIRLACARVSGSIFLSFWRASVERD